PFAKFEVNNIDFEQIGALAYTSRLSSTRNWGMFGSAQRSTLQNIGIRGQAVAPNSVLFNNTASIFGTSAMPSNIGVMGLAQGQTWNIGGAFMANEQFCGRQNIGVYASARNSCPSGFVDMAGFF